MHELSEAARHGFLALDGVQQFYEALNAMFAGDLTQMREIWSKSPDATLMGPFGGRRVGYEEVMWMFQRDAGLKKGGRIQPKDLFVRIGSDIIYSACCERGEVTTSSGKAVPVCIRATNILEAEGEDVLRLVYHHTDPMPAMLEASGAQAERFAPPKDGAANADPDILRLMGQFGAAVSGMFAGDIRPMAEIWATDDEVSFACPGGGIVVGWEAITAEMQRHAKAGIRGDIEFKSPIVRVHGDMAYVSALAVSPYMMIGGRACPMNARTTTICRADEAGWRIVHHQADLAADAPVSHK